MGILFDKVHWLVQPADHRVTRLSLCVSQLLHRSSAPASLLATLLGLMGLSGEVVAVSPVLECPCSPRFLVSSSDNSLVGPILGLSGGAHLSASPSGGTLHGCIQQGFGCSHGHPVSSGHLVPSSVLPSHQPAQAGGWFPGASTVSSLSPGMSCSEHGQHDSGLVLADSLSKSHMILHMEWTLDSADVASVWDAWFRPLVDLFAMRFIHRLPTFVSPVPDPAAWAVDSLSVPWAGLLVYVFPPLPILSKVLKKAREEQATLILIALKWPAQPWFPDLLCLSHVPPLKLHLHPRALLQPRSRVAHTNPGLLDLHAWLLCGTRLH